MEERAQFWKMTGRGVSLAIIVCLAAVLIFALVIQFTGLPESVIMPVNQFIKVLAIFIGCFFSLRGSKGWLKGGACRVDRRRAYLSLIRASGRFSVRAQDPVGSAFLRRSGDPFGNHLGESEKRLKNPPKSLTFEPRFSIINKKNTSGGLS